jgi:hypothetical protein
MNDLIRTLTETVQPRAISGWPPAQIPPLISGVVEDRNSSIRENPCSSVANVSDE